MTGKQNATVRMFRAVKIYCDSMNAAWNPFMPFNLTYATFTTELAALDLLTPEQAKQTQVVTAPKVAKREALEAKTAYLALALKTYGTVTNNPAVMAEGEVSASKIKRLSDEELIDQADLLYAAAGPLTVALQTYGIVDPLPPANPWLFQYELDTAGYLTLIGTPQAAKAYKRDMTAAIAAKIKVISGILNKQLDNAALLLQTTQPAFASGYKAVRTIDDAAHSKIALRIIVTDDVTGMPMQKVLVKLEPSQISRHTSAKGICQVTNLPDGVEQVSCSITGYVNAHKTANITNGLTAEVSIKMIAA